MNVSCPSCSTRYSVDDARIPQSGVTIKCPKCQHVFVAKKDGQTMAPPPPRAASAVALPGSAAPGSRGAPVALPGSKGAAPPAARRPPAAEARPAQPKATPAPPRGAGRDNDELDLGLDEPPAAAPPPVRSTPSPSKPAARSTIPPAAASTPPPRPPPPSKASKDTLNFIDETAGKAGLNETSKSSSTEFRVRRRNGRVEGPYGAGRIITMLRNKEFTGGEDISEDGLQWRSLTSNPQFNGVINELAAHEEGLSFGQVDLPAPAQNLPAPALHRELPDKKRGGARSSGQKSVSLDIDPPVEAEPSEPKSGEFDLGFEEEEERPSHKPAGPSLAKPPAGAAPGLAQSDSLADLDLDRPGGEHEEKPKKKKPAAPPPEEGAPPVPEGGPDSLEVGEIPQLPPIWQTYRKPILAFVGVIALFLIGFFTHLWSPCGAYGVKCVATLFKPAPPPPPQAPPPPPPKLADPKELASLIDEGSFEAFRSVFATVEKLGPTLPDNVLASAKARGFATLAYGPPAFPLEQLAKSVEILNTLDLNKAMGGNAALAGVEIAKARAALQIAQGLHEAAAKEMSAQLEQRVDDKEIAYLLGLARVGLNDFKGALEALDKAIVADPHYAPALHAIGDIVLGQAQAEDAAAWYGKALAAQPAHTRSAVAAAKIYQQLNQFGPRRRVLALAAEKAERGLPSDKQAAFVFEAAKALIDADQYEKALPLATEAARLDPANVQYVAATSSALSATGKAKEAQALIDPFLTRDPTNVEALLARARAFVAMDDVAKAFLDLEAAKKTAPKDPRVPLFEAKFNIELAKLSDARDALNRALKMDPTNARANVDLGRVELMVGDVDAAFKNATEAVQKDPNSSRAHAILGDCLLLRDEIEKAVDEYTRAIKLDDENITANIGYANALRDMGAKNPKLRSKISEAVPIYLRALADNPKNSTVMFEYGRALEIEGDVNAALELYREAASLDQKDLRPHLKMAAANIEKDPPDLQEAAKSLAIARKIEAGSQRPNGHLRFWEARLAFLENKVHDAEASMRSAVEAEPRNALFHYWLGRVLEANNSLYEAIGYYEKATSLNSRLAVAWRALGRTSLERNQFEKAREYFEKYREAAPEDHAIWVDIGESYTKQNREEQAMDAFQRAIQFDPKSSKALLEIGILLERQGKTSEAGKFFERSAKADPKNGDAWCYYGASINTKERLTKDARAALEKCLELPNASDDLKASAKDALETGGGKGR